MGCGASAASSGDDARGGGAKTVNFADIDKTIALARSGLGCVRTADDGVRLAEEPASRSDGAVENVQDG